MFIHSAADRTLLKLRTALVSNEFGPEISCVHSISNIYFSFVEQIADSFPGVDHISQTVPPQQIHPEQSFIRLPKAPKWIKKPVGVSFGVSTISIGRLYIVEKVANKAKFSVRR